MNERFIKIPFALKSIIFACILAFPLHLTYSQAKNPPLQPTEADAIDEDAAVGKIPLRVLYVGLPGTKRQEDFVTFFGRFFQVVIAGDYNTFKEEQAKDCDVAIFDKDGLEWAPLKIEVSDQYSRATISIGVPGAFWCDRKKLKTGYM